MHSFMPRKSSDPSRASPTMPNCAKTETLWDSRENHAIRKKNKVRTVTRPKWKPTALAMGSV